MVGYKTQNGESMLSLPLLSIPTVPLRLLSSDLSDSAFIFPDEATAHIFISITSRAEYFAFSETCARAYKISRSIFIIPRVSIHVRRVLLIRSLFHFRELLESRSKLLEKYQMMNASNLSQSRELSKAVNLAKDEFYKTFIGFCEVFQVDLNDAEFPYCAYYFQKIAAPFDLSKQIYVDMIHGYADQPIDRVIMSSFRQKVAEIEAYYPNYNVVEIETDMRRSLYTKKREAFQLLAKELLKPKAMKYMYSAIKTRRTMEYQRTASRIQQEIEDLPKQINHTWDEKKSIELQYAQFEMEEYNNEAQDQFLILQKKLEEIGKKINMLIEKYWLLKGNADELQGMFQKTLLKLISVEEMAEKEVYNLIRFYFELAREVTEENKVARYVALHRFLDE